MKYLVNFFDEISYYFQVPTYLIPLRYLKATPDILQYIEIPVLRLRISYSTSDIWIFYEKSKGCFVRYFECKFDLSLLIFSYLNPIQDISRYSNL